MIGVRLECNQRRIHNAVYPSIVVYCLERVQKSNLILNSAMMTYARVASSYNHNRVTRRAGIKCLREVSNTSYRGNCLKRRVCYRQVWRCNGRHVGNAGAL